MNVKMTMVVVVRFAPTLKEALNVLVLMVISWIVMELLVQVLCVTINLTIKFCIEPGSHYVHSLATKIVLLNNTIGQI